MVNDKKDDGIEDRIDDDDLALNAPKSIVPNYGTLFCGSSSYGQHPDHYVSLEPEDPLNPGIMEWYKE